MTTDSKDQVWFITGCSSGFGKELTATLLESGRKVVVTARKLDNLKELLTKYSETSIGLVVDVTKQKDVDDAVADALKKWGKIDVLVNNAGFSQVITVNEAIGEQNVRDLFEVNYFGLQRVTNAVLPHFRSKKSGHIINICSGLSIITVPMIGAYSATKHAVLGLTEGYKLELAPLGIRVTAVLPGIFRTQFGQPRAPPSVNPSEIADYDILKAHLPNFSEMKMSNPVLAAKKIVAVHDDPKVPFHVFLGSDSAQMAKTRAKELIDEAETVEKLIGCDCY